VLASEDRSESPVDADLPLPSSLEEALAEESGGSIPTIASRDAESYLDEGNVYFNVGQFGMAIDRYTKAIVEKEAQKGRAYSCEALYLDPGWDTDFATFLWGEQWLGPRKQFIEEMKSTPDILALVKNGRIDEDVYPLSVELLREFRSSTEFTTLVAAKMSLGSEIMKEIGNVYCAALPAWIAAGMEDAYLQGIPLAGGKVLAVGYGSGDAAEAIPMSVMPGWERAAAKIGFAAALEQYQDLTRAQYESLHDTGDAPGLHHPEEGFVIESIGTSTNPNMSDEGIEYYRLLS
jgi:hypothetical protein